MRNLLILLMLSGFSLPVFSHGNVESYGGASMKTERYREERSARNAGKNRPERGVLTARSDEYDSPVKGNISGVNSDRSDFSYDASDASADWRYPR